MLTEGAWLRTQASIKKGGFGIRGPALHSSAAFLASSSSTSALYKSFWSEFKDTHDPDETAAETQFRLGVGGDAAWRQDGAPRTQSYLSNLCDAHTLDSLIYSATQGDRVVLRIRQAALVLGGANSPLFDWDADLIRSALQHRLRIHFSTRTHNALVRPSARPLL